MAFEGLIQSTLNKKEVFRQRAFQRIDQEVVKYRQLTQEQAQEFTQEQLLGLCPSPSELQRLLRLKQTLQENILRLNRTLIPIQTVTTEVLQIISAIRPIITGLKLIPLPAQFATVGVIVTLGDVLDTIKQTLDTLTQEISNLNYSISATQDVLLEVNTRLNTIDVILNLCTTQDLSIQEPSEEFQALIADLNQSRNTQPLSEEYNGFTIEVRNDPDSPPIAPKRFAVAISPTGATVYKGPSSFSSSTKILIDEVRFYIDQLIS